MRRSALITGLAGAAVVALTWAAIATSRGLPGTLPRHLLLYMAAGLTWLAAAFVTERLAPSRGQLIVIAFVALALRVPAWLSPPAHSDDIHRYVWDGKVQRAGVNPYRFAPDAAELSSLRDANWARINNRSLPTIYPPLAEAAFAACPSLGAWKLLVAVGDAAVALLLYMGLADRRRVVLWAWSPLVVIELALNGHVDALGVALLVGGLVAWQRGRRAAAGALVAAAAAVKLLPIVALAGMRSRKALIAAAIVAVVLALPYATAGTRMAGSLGEYSRRWRVNDGAFALLYA
ncbi:MAG: glycosyltransferase 87 family protein, partial [Myxococcales bacterium]|nr:glycosyltransferase 87 family protein [Myxococcales bacterium]